jgi:hypothetical protein
MLADRCTDMTKLRMAFCNFVNVRKKLSRVRNGNPAVQPTALNAMRRLRVSYLRPVRVAELLLANFVKFRRRFLIQNVTGFHSACHYN